MGISHGGFVADPEYAAVPVSPTPDAQAKLEASGHDVVVVRGTIEESKIAELESHADVIKVWKDAPISPFAKARSQPALRPRPASRPRPAENAGPMAACPVPPCDCTFGNPANGNIAGVAHYLGVDQIWAAGNHGDGIVIGIVDGGITAIGRVPKPGEVARVPRVTDGSLPDWGTTASAWGDHGNMTSTDALGMAPNVHIYDIRVSGGASTVSNALAGFQWAINRHAVDGTPHILSNSWGIFQQASDPVYATDPNHPFTRKVVEAINAGILVLFAAGNCGATCPDGRCGPDTGAGHDIWGANGHPMVMTVGAVNLSEQLVGYSSVGPAALDPHKPDFCSITHFAGYFPTVEPGEPSDTGTSAATPIAAGVVALLKQHVPGLTQDQAKNALRNTAKDIGPAGWDQFTGAGIIRAKAAWDSVTPKLKIFDDVTTKLHDDPTLKPADDITLKTTDDITTKLHDDPTLKPADDATAKPADDITLKVTDDVTTKLHDDPTLKPADDATAKVADDITVKAADDITLKLHDDPTLKPADDATLKTADDVTLKLQDDVTVKASDDVTVKVQDDITLKASDDPTLKTADDVTLKLQDDHGTIKTLDDGTVKTLDDHVTLKTLDDHGTVKSLDDGTVKALDDHGTIKVADDGIPGPNPPGGDPGPGGGVGASAPFILSTPHHSMAWAAGGSAQQVPQAGAPSQFQQYEAALAALEQEINRRSLELGQLDAQYRTMLAEFQALGGQR